MRRSPSAVVGLLFSVCVLSAASAPGGEPKQAAWKPLMDGRTLAGWHKVGDGTWAVENGAFVGRAHKEKLYGLLFSDAKFKDFTVRFKFKCLTGDSGFYIRTLLKPPEQAHGFQVQVGPPGSGSGRIYESYGRGWLEKPVPGEDKKFLKPTDWNEVTIAAHGGRVVVHVNGLKITDLEDDKGRPEGHFALQMHSGCEMEVSFKEIEISE